MGVGAFICAHRYWVFDRISIRLCCCSFCLPLETHINFAFNPFSSMRNINLLYIIVGEAAHVAQFIDVVHEVAQLVRNVLGVLVREFQLLLVCLADAIQRLLNRVEIHESFAVLVLSELDEHYGVRAASCCHYFYFCKFILNN